MTTRMGAVRGGSPGRPRGRRLVAAFAVALAACATPAEQVRDRAAELGFETVQLTGAGFDHVAFVADSPGNTRTLHVYVEHDGTPWLDRTHIAADPTPRTPVALELMARDAGPRLFLGRPCYFAPEDAPRCAPSMWTDERYSAEVVRSMVAALRGYLSTRPHDRVVLIGYSGGGTLAWLMAREVPETVAVVTLAANLDIDLWAELHTYSPLAGSLNPTLQPALAPAIVQLHYAGIDDRNVPPAVVESFAHRHSKAKFVVLGGFDHRCCWIDRWPQLLDPIRPGSGIVDRPPS